MRFPLTISIRQKQNPLIEFLKGISVKWSEDSVADFNIASSTAVLFLSVKYHRVKPEYFPSRIKALAGPFQSRILLLLVDVENPEYQITTLTQVASINQITTILAFSYEECSRWLSSLYFSQELTPDDLKAIDESQDEVAFQAVHSLGFPRPIAESMVSSFQTLSDLLQAPPEQLSKEANLGKGEIEALKASVLEPFNHE